MKKCPFCKAEIEENARFCLYCMAQLDEKSVISAKRKKHRMVWWVVLACAAAAIIAVCLLFVLSDGSAGDESSLPSRAESREESSEAPSFTTDVNLDNGESSASEQESSISEEESSASEETSEDSSVESREDSSEISVEISVETSTSVSEDSSIEESSIVESSIVESSIIESSEEESSTAESSEDTSEPKQEIKYIYRDAVVGDDWGSISTENAITIIGVETVSADGTYVIPDTIDGKRVLAVAGYAFSDEKICGTVKKVIVAESVKNIHNYAFKNCNNMTDIYLKSEAVAGSPLYFLPEMEKRKNVITLHASATCHDRDHRIYKSTYSYYELLGKPIGIFEEWDGSE